MSAIPLREALERLVEIIDRDEETWIVEEYQAVIEQARSALAASQPSARGGGLRDHEPRWEQDRDDPVGMWRCDCRQTFAPDDFEGYWRHLCTALDAEAAR